MSKLKKSNKLYKAAFVTLFLMNSVFPAVNLNTDIESRTEQRRLASAPFLIVNGQINPKLAEQTESWLRDRFGTRNFLLWANSRAEAALAVWQSDSAIKGKDGWLFLKETTNSFYNQNLFSQQELEKIRDGIRKKQAMIKAEGAGQYYLLICPNKNQIYGEEFYPDYIINAGSRGKKSRAQQLTDYLKSCGDINVVYPLETMLAEKKANPEHIIYYRTDTHWNSHGAFIAYKELASVIRKDFPDFQGLSYDDFTITKTSPEPGCDEEFNGKGVEGDLLRMFNGRTINELGIKQNYVDKLIYNKGNFRHTYLKFSAEEGRKGIISNCEGKSYKAVVYRDSFGKALEPFISESFFKAEYVWTRNFAKHFNVVKRNKPDIVIEEVVERYLPVLLTNAETDK